MRAEFAAGNVAEGVGPCSGVVVIMTIGPPVHVDDVDGTGAVEVAKGDREVA